MALSIITDKFRIENAKKFIQSIKSRPYPAIFSTTQTDYEREKVENLDGENDVLYMFIGKITSWYDPNNLPAGAENAEVPVPDARMDFRQETEVWANAIAAKQISPLNVKHAVYRENWSNNTKYPYFRSDASNTTTLSSVSEPNFFVLDENEFRVYKCLFNNYSSLSTQRPSLVGGIGGDTRRIQREPFFTNDGYLWKYMYTIDPSDALNFLTADYIPVSKDDVNDDGTNNNATVDGAVYKIAITQKITNEDATEVVPSPSSTSDFIRVKLEDSTVINDTGNEKIIVDITDATNRQRIASDDPDDMVNYQIEHVIDDGSTKIIEVAKIVSSTVDINNLELTYERLDNEGQPFTSISGGETENWFISPYIEIGGEGKNASAVMRIDGEDTFFESSTQAMFIGDLSSFTASEGGAVDIIMISNGEGYRNIFKRNDKGLTRESYVRIKRGESALGSDVATGLKTDPDDRDIQNFAQIVSVTPFGGHSYDNVSELYGYSIIINVTFSGDETGSATVQNDFRNIALIQNPLELDESLADADIYRQTIKIQVDGNQTSILSPDALVTNVAAGLKGKIVEFEFDSGLNRTTIQLSSTVGFFDLEAQDFYDVGTLVVNGETMTITDQGIFEKGLGSGVANQGLLFTSGDVMYVENRQPIIRAADQSENIKLIIEY